VQKYQDRNPPQPRVVPRSLDLSQVPHPRRAFVLAARVGYLQPFIVFALYLCALSLVPLSLVPSFPLSLFYSCLNASIGSTPAALPAGIQLAITATPSITATAHPSVTGS